MATAAAKDIERSIARPSKRRERRRTDRAPGPWRENGDSAAIARLDAIRRRHLISLRLQGVAVALDIKRRAQACIAPAVFLAVAGYFSWNAMQGNRGLAAAPERIALRKQVEADREAALAERARMERKVAGLRSSQLDPDTLDERARALLNLADPADVVVQYQAKDKLF
jgi:cell division protein FtsB